MPFSNLAPEAIQALMEPRQPFGVRELNIAEGKQPKRVGPGWPTADWENQPAGMPGPTAGPGAPLTPLAGVMPHSPFSDAIASVAPMPTMPVAPGGASPLARPAPTSYGGISAPQMPPLDPNGMARQFQEFDKQMGPFKRPFWAGEPGDGVPIDSRSHLFHLMGSVLPAMEGAHQRERMNQYQNLFKLDTMRSGDQLRAETGLAERALTNKGNLDVATLAAAQDKTRFAERLLERGENPERIRGLMGAREGFNRELGMSRLGFPGGPHGGPAPFPGGVVPGTKGALTPEQETDAQFVKAQNALSLEQKAPILEMAGPKYNAQTLASRLGGSNKAVMSPGFLGEIDAQLRGRTTGSQAETDADLQQQFIKHASQILRLQGRGRGTFGGTPLELKPGWVNNEYRIGKPAGGSTMMRRMATPQFLGNLGYRPLEYLSGYGSALPNFTRAGDQTSEATANALGALLKQRYGYRGE